VKNVRKLQNLGHILPHNHNYAGLTPIMHGRRSQQKNFRRKKA